MAMDEALGLGKPLSEPANANVDIIFVHGLNGHRIKTWTFQPTADIPLSTFWPKDLLPVACKTARILSFGYDSNFLHFFPLGKGSAPGSTVADHSSALLASLSGLRKSTESLDRPIIFIAHGLGGLVVANALSRTHGGNNANRMVANSTCGVIFLGTPFEGSVKARWGLVGIRFLSLQAPTKKDDIKELEERSQQLAGINCEFLKLLKHRDRDQSSSLEVACFFEEHPTFVGVKNCGVIVEKSSAGTLLDVDPVPIAASHTGMCRFAGDYSAGYTMISKLVRRWIETMGKDPGVGVQQNNFVGPTHYHGDFQNHGVLSTYNNSSAQDGNRLIGTNSTNYYGDSWGKYLNGGHLKQ